MVLSNVKSGVRDLLVFDTKSATQAAKPGSAGVKGDPCSALECQELCLHVGGGEAQCQCSSHKTLDPKTGKCSDPSEFLLFGQKNKISRMLMSGTRGQDHHKTNSSDKLLLNSEDGLDVVLPIQKARDIRSLSFDTANGLIYWIDHGSKRKNHHHHHNSPQSEQASNAAKISIKRAYTNGTMPERR